MLFNSFQFLIFLPTVFILYWFVFKNKLKLQNLLLLLSSYVFYGWWDWRFLLLIVFSSFVDYFCGIQIDKEKKQRTRKLWLTVSMVVNLGFLGVFKYFNFFSNSLSEAFNNMGYQIDALTLDVILPVGISFYTFQTMSYTIDIYREKLKPTKDLICFFAYVSFFPQLVAGPIERATNLLPQFYQKRVFSYNNASDGLRQILFGLFKKIVIADNCAIIVNQVFNDYTNVNSSTLLVGAIFFAFQIYGDFSGYSDIAIGTARILGFNLMQNFAFPYFSRDIAEFWRRWHISLSTWFRDYVYIPLGGSRGNVWKKVRNTFIIFLISGFWHGANWTFIIWGGINAIYFIPLLLLNKNRTNTNLVAEGRTFINLREFFQVMTTFSLTVLGWIFFRAETLSQAINYINLLFTKTLFVIPRIDLKPFIFIIIMIIFEWFHRNKQHGLAIDYIKMTALRWSLYIFLFLMILLFGAQSQSFIYFQF